MTTPEKPDSPLSAVAATPVERTAGEKYQDAMPSVAGAADPHVLADGVGELPLASGEDAEQAVRDGAAEAGKTGGDQPE